MQAWALPARGRPGLVHVPGHADHAHAGLLGRYWCDPEEVVREAKGRVVRRRGC